jgi:hypothetical protein
MEGNSERAVERERDFKGKRGGWAEFVNVEKWRVSAKGNQWRKWRGLRVVVCRRGGGLTGMVEGPRGKEWLDGVYQGSAVGAALYDAAWRRKDEAKEARREAARFEAAAEMEVMAVLNAVGWRE